MLPAQINRSSRGNEALTDLCSLTSEFRASLPRLLRLKCKVSERFIKDRQHEVCISLCDAHWRSEANRVSAEAAFADEQTHFAAVFHYLGAFSFGRLFGRAIFDQ